LLSNYAQINIYLWTFGKLIGNIISNTISISQQQYSSNPNDGMVRAIRIILEKIKNDIEYNQKDTKTRGRERDSVLIIIANLTFLFIFPLLKVTIFFNNTF
jgi:hypothetical protein